MQNVEAIAEKLKQLPEAQQEEVADFVEFLLSRVPQEPDAARVLRESAGIWKDEADGTAYENVLREQRKDNLIDHDLERNFGCLAQQWRRETMAMSSLTDIVLHPAYYQIIGMGEPALPLILRELQQRGGHWFLALRAISRQDPVKREDRGKVKKMTQAWLDWGKEHGLLDSEDGRVS